MPFTPGVISDKRRDRGSIRLQRGGKAQSLAVMQFALRALPSLARWIGSRLEAGMTAEEGDPCQSRLASSPTSAARSGSIRLQRGGKAQSLEVVHCAFRPVPFVVRWIGSRLEAGMIAEEGDPCQSRLASSPTSGARSWTHSFAERREGAEPCSDALRPATTPVCGEVDWIPAQGRDDR